MSSEYLFHRILILPDINLAKYCTSKLAHPVVENSIHWEYNFLFLPTIILFYKTLTSLNKLFLFSSILSSVSKQDMDRTQEYNLHCIQNKSYLLKREVLFGGNGNK